MTQKLNKQFWEMSFNDGPFSPPAMALYSVLLYFMDRNNETEFTLSDAKIGCYTSYGLRGIRDAGRELQKRGLLTVTRLPGRNSQPRYDLNPARNPAPRAGFTNEQPETMLETLLHEQGLSHIVQLNPASRAGFTEQNGDIATVVLAVNRAVTEVVTGDFLGESEIIENVERVKNVRFSRILPPLNRPAPRILKNKPDSNNLLLLKTTNNIPMAGGQGRTHTQAHPDTHTPAHTPIHIHTYTHERTTHEPGVLVFSLNPLNPVLHNPDWLLVGQPALIAFFEIDESKGSDEETLLFCHAHALTRFPSKSECLNVFKKWVKNWRTKLNQQALVNIPVETRIKALQADLDLYRDNHPGKYEQSVYDGFMAYWGEPMQHAKGKILKDSAKTWDLGKRLATSYRMIWLPTHEKQLKQTNYANRTNSADKSAADNIKRPYEYDIERALQTSQRLGHTAPEWATGDDTD